MRLSRKLLLAETALIAIAVIIAFMAVWSPVNAVVGAAVVLAAGTAGCLFRAGRLKTRHRLEKLWHVASRRHIREAGKRKTLNGKYLEKIAVAETWVEHGFHSLAEKRLKAIEESEWSFEETRRSAASVIASIPDPRDHAEPEERFDVVVVSNFNLPGGTTESNRQELSLLAENGAKVAVVHHPLVQHCDRPLNPKIEQVIDQYGIRRLGPDDSVKADILLMRFPPFATTLRDDLPRIDAENRALVVNQTPMTYYSSVGGRKKQWDVQNVVENLDAWAGPQTWFPVGPQVAEALAEHHADEFDLGRVSADHWYPSFDIAAVERRSGYRDAFDPDDVVIGRHSRDHSSKWPELAKHIHECYPSGEGHTVRVLGGGSTPERILGRIPVSWQVLPFTSDPVESFLAGLDVYVYFLHSQYVEAFGRAPVEAMNSGVPVILPPKFRTLFGEAALYCSPSEVRSTVDALSSDEGLYRRQQDAGYRLVDDLFSHDVQWKRFEKLGLKTR
ncbi:glycosyltransferase [Salininema proteolyticum]|uniref:Glycosyltransferase n=1 Tax=Salininema proteolyticum TaxID=1607685 RepID=A0ABV8TX31_9ACTN